MIWWINVKYVSGEKVYLNKKMCCFMVLGIYCLFLLCWYLLFKWDIIVCCEYKLI